MNEVYHGDCLELMNRIGDKSIDMICCDLPYGTTRNRWDSIIPFDQLWKQYERIIKDNGAIVLTASQPFTAQLVLSNPKLFKYSLVWEKTTRTGFLNAKKQPLRIHEDILVFCKKQPTYNPQFTAGKPYKTKSGKPTDNYNHFDSIETVSNGQRYPTSIIKVNSVANGSAEKVKHSTQKPVLLLEYLIKTFSNEGDVVLDNCAGSGSTGVACKNLNRNFILMEKDEGYYNMIVDRMKNVVDEKKEA